ncbi:Hypothetical predicted protein [Cloeon dipterum]|uniref:b(0,+)-type amino acid transporter 1 n=1 Tax=Cloeon dipterum TaxID=197152 RepID=A0A8S1C3U6_9INSE|nr:Hypothetical predicted protein [Cloeon dipterum]
MIGSGIFVSPTSAFQRAGSVGLTLIIWAASGLISMLGALAFAELGGVVPRSGAEYVYFQEAFGNRHKFFGPLPSFVYAWVFVMGLRPAEATIIILVFAQYTFQPFEEAYGQDLTEDQKYYIIKGVAMIGLIIITTINILSVKLYNTMQKLFTFSKLAVCVAIIIGGLISLGQGKTENLKDPFSGEAPSVKDIALAFYAGLWAYDGWSMVTTVTEEVKRPEKNILRSICIAVPLVTLVYCFMNLSYMTVLSGDEMINAPAVAVLFAERIFGSMKLIAPIGVAISTIGCALSMQFGVSRLCYVAAKNGQMLSVLSYIHRERLTPIPAVILQGLISCIFILSGDVANLIDFASFLIWIFYGGAMIALVMLRKSHADVARPYKVPIVIPFLVLAVAIFLAVVPIATDPNPKYLVALGFIITGFFVYIPFVYYKVHLSCVDTVTDFIQRKLNVVPTDDTVEEEK